MFPYKMVVVIVATLPNGTTSRTRFTDRAIAVSDAMATIQRMVETNTIWFNGELLEVSVESVSITRDDSPYTDWQDKVRTNMHHEVLRMQRS